MTKFLDCLLILTILLVPVAAGVLLYTRSHTNQQRSLTDELHAYVEDQAECSTSGNGGGLNEQDIDVRDTAISAQMLRQLGVASVKLLTADAAHATYLQRCGVVVTGTTSQVVGDSAGTPAAAAPSANGTASGPVPVER